MAQIFYCCRDFNTGTDILSCGVDNSYKAEGNKQNRLLYIVTYITCFVVFTDCFLKFNIGLCGVALSIALPFPYIVFLPVFLIVTSKNKNFNITIRSLS